MIIANKKTIKLETSYSVYSKCLQQVKSPTENTPRECTLAITQYKMQEY